MKITDNAKTKLKNIISESPGKGIRVYVASMGWGGPQIGMVLDEPKNDDILKEINEIQVSFDKMAFDYAKNLTLDTKDDNLILLNPNSSC